MKTAVLALISVVLAGCSPAGTGNGFAPPAVAPAKVAQSSDGIRRPLLRVARIRGTSNRARRNIRDALTIALKLRGIDVVKRPAPHVLNLEGSLSALNEGNVTTYTYEWRLTDAQGALRAKPIVGFERSAGGSSDMWGSVGGNALKIMSERIAHRIALALGRTG